MFFIDLYSLNPIILEPVEYKNPCVPSPCGPNSQCRELNNQAICSCLPGYIGAPPGCRPECVVSAECELTKACVNQKCIDPCPGTCGFNARCNVVNHSPICSCKPGFTGDPFIQCRYIEPEPIPKPQDPPINPCYPSPCGFNARCDNVDGKAVCTCLPDFIGQPPNCRPECRSNSECDTSLACINMKCKDPCPGSCGSNARCHVINHVPICTCPVDFTGDPFTRCSRLPRKKFIYFLVSGVASAVISNASVQSIYISQLINSISLFTDIKFFLFKDFNNNMI